MTDKAMPALPEQSGWGLDMHGYIVAFCSNAEKAIGHSPGAETPMFTNEQMFAYGRKCIDECIKALVDGDCFVAEMQGMNKAVRTIQWRFGIVDVDRAEQ